MSRHAALALLCLLLLVTGPAAAQTASPTAPAGPEGNGLALLGILVVALALGGTLLGAVASLAALALLRFLGPFDAWVRFLLPVVFTAVPAVALLRPLGEFAAVPGVVALLASAVAGLFFRRGDPEAAAGPEAD